MADRYVSASGKYKAHVDKIAAGRVYLTITGGDEPMTVQMAIVEWRRQCQEGRWRKVEAT